MLTDAFQTSAMKHYILLLILCISSTSIQSITYDALSGTFDDINVVVTPNQFNASQCPDILDNIKDLFQRTSNTLSDELNHRFGKINLRLPRTWTDEYCYKEGHIIEHQPSDSQNFDVILGPFDKLANGQPWTQQFDGCRQKGDFIYIPNTKPFNKSEGEVDLFAQWNRYYHGLYTDDPLSTNVSSGSKQDAFCSGASAFSIISSHLHSRKVNPKFRSSQPKFIISREVAPKYVLVLENSLAMNVNNSWSLIKKALRKFIKEDLLDVETQVGLVLFNEAASIKQTVAKIGPKHSTMREKLDFMLPEYDFLSPQLESCVRCGIVKAIEALQTSGSTIGANLIIISQGHINVLSREDDKELTNLAAKHQLRLFTLPFVHQAHNFSILFESLSYATNANSFIMNPEKFDLDLYIDLVDSLREVQRRSESNGPSLVHEQIFQPLESDKLEERGSFFIDRHVGNNTKFQLYTVGDIDKRGFIKEAHINDRRQNKYSTFVKKYLHDYKFATIFQVPFESDRNLDMLWTYSFEKWNAKEPHKFISQVVTRPRISNEDIQVKFFTNVQSHAIHVNQSQPLKLFVEVTLNHMPVVEARVHLKVKVTKHRTQATEEFTIQLFDYGNGDPDVKSGDGIYSRYFTHFKTGEGRYDIQIIVDNEHGTAFYYQPMTVKGSEQTRLRNVNLDTFQRIVKGDSFRIMSLSPTTDFAPSRVLDLSAFVHVDKRQVQLTWTAPGDILDYGQPFTYKIFISDLSSSFYKRDIRLLEHIEALQVAYGVEKFDLNFDKFPQDSYLAIAAVNKHEKMSGLSNVVHVKLPSAFKPDEANKYTSQDSSVHIQPTEKKSDKVLFYVLFSIVGVLLICILAIISIFKAYGKSHTRSISGSQEDPMEHFDIIDVTDEDAIVNKTSNIYEQKSELTLPTFYKSNISILKNAEESLCNCHEVNNDQDLVINPYINYSASLNRGHAVASSHNQVLPALHVRQEPIYANQQELNYNPIYSVVNKSNKNNSKNVRIVLDNETETEEEEMLEDEGTQERCLTPSNTYLELSFDQEQQHQRAVQETPKNTFVKEVAFTSTPNQQNNVTITPSKVRTITQV